MKTYDQLMEHYRALMEDVAANNVGTPSGISPPAAANATSTNVLKIKKRPALVRRPKPAK